jgi:hypothetical protein
VLSLAVDGHEISVLIAELRATRPQAQKALYSTMVKMAAWIRTRSVRGVSERVKIQQKILRQRVRTFRLGGPLSHATNDRSVKVWYGLNAVPWAKLSPRATRKGGVTAYGGRHDKEAFIALYSGHPQVLKRVGKDRLPLEVVKADIEPEAMKYIEEFVLASAEFESQFLKIFERELRWRTSTRT